jgi:membrane-bound lytic murein transglycosylase D
MNPPPPAIASMALSLLRVIVGSAADGRREYQFQDSFRIGRAEDCDVCVNNDAVSRYHAYALFHDGQWWVRDLQSTNGIVVDGQRVSAVPVGQRLTVRLGFDGPFVGFEVDPVVLPDVRQEGRGPEHAERYFVGRDDEEPAGEQTMMIRRAYKRVQAKQNWMFAKIIGGLGLLVLAVGAVAVYEHWQVSEQKAIAKEIFYTMKTLDVDIANVERMLADSASAETKAQFRSYESRRKDMEVQYDRFLSTLQVYDSGMTEQDRLVLRVARIFGECELTMPIGFSAEVKRYIKRWQSTDRLARALKTANEKGYAVKIAQELLAQDLPPQFFYLALQESSFDPYISGPPTKYGIAKGMWQFIPETGRKYGLRIGPLATLPRPDPSDDRDHWELATRAAARYLKDIYSTDAQASGLLVMASYNWGEQKVIRLIQGMPANPRERNFWRLLTEHRDQIPQETYDYVFYIVAAAVVGENPRLFGFDFDNPLAHIESK